MQDTGSLGLVHWDDPEGWYGEGGGRGFQDGEHVYTLGGFMLMYCFVRDFRLTILFQCQVTLTHRLTEEPRWTASLGVEQGPRHSHGQGQGDSSGLQGPACGRPFAGPVATAEFFKFAGILSVALSQHHLSGFEIAQLEFHHFH